MQSQQVSDVFRPQQRSHSRRRKHPRVSAEWKYHRKYPDGDLCGCSFRIIVLVLPSSRLDSSDCHQVTIYCTRKQPLLRGHVQKIASFRASFDYSRFVEWAF
ncbi:hypothetical protein BLNAU_11527 [Blattamonas nauphoetae]|uniref:Uncharacterized protein n=1 Tax=Blattamonas nauphoetae TaxID=2049346 RepID=A0ABQ9XM93_9EUKA|nr:hypothetical protein BLNAU_11527 [Blattamonas nauphoetae]